MRLLILRHIMKPTRRIKVKNGIEYWYEETPYYDKEKKQIRHTSKYLGRNVDGQPVRMRSAPDEVKEKTKKKTAEAKSSFDYGSIFVLQSIMEELNLDCQRRSKSAQIRRSEGAQIYKYLPPSVSLTQFLNSYAGVSPAFFVP
jgi:hypothetical protein